MAALDQSPESISRKDVIRARGLFHIKSFRGTTYVAKWPSKRGPIKSELQKAWVTRFSCLARMLKAPPPPILDAAKSFAAGTGWYYRDVLEVAAAAKIIRFNGEVPVTTPTVYLRRLAAYPVPQNVETNIPMDTMEWDNNAFWNPLVNPERITIKAPGLYLFNAEWNIPGGVNGNPVGLIYLNDTDQLAVFYTGSAGAYMTQPCPGIWYFHANDYITFRLVENTSGVNVIVRDFWMVAITPEALIP